MKKSKYVASLFENTPPIIPRAAQLPGYTSLEAPPPEQATSLCWQCLLSIIAKDKGKFLHRDISSKQPAPIEL